MDRARRFGKLRLGLRAQLVSTRAFTLIEVLIIVLIIGIMIAVAAPSFLGQSDKAHDSVAQQYLGLAWKAERAAKPTIENNGLNPVNDSISASDPNAPDRVATITAAISTESVFTTVVGGPCSLADTPRKIVVDPATSTDQLILYTKSASGKVWRLRAGDTGAPSKGPVFDLACANTGTQGVNPPPPPPCMPWTQTDPLTGVVTPACPIEPPTPTGTHTLFVNPDGDGTGTVASAPGSIDCGNVCSGDFNTTTSVTLTATPALGSHFVRWGGGCQGTSPTCIVKMNSDVSITAYFARNASGPYQLAVAKAGNGSGIVKSLDSGGTPDAAIDCGTNCQQSYPADTVVTLRAYPGPTSSFTGWAGACSGTEVTCQVTLSQSNEAIAVFDPQDGATKKALMVSLDGLGSGVVESNPFGITCLDTCVQSYDPGTDVALQATAKGDSDFAGWSGGPCDAGGGSADVCVVTMSEAKSVTATFTKTAKNLLTVSLDGGDTSGGGTGAAPSWSGPHYPALVNATPGLEAYWRFDTGQHGPKVLGYSGSPITSTIPDTSGNGHSLAASNIAWGESPNMYRSSGSNADSSIFFDGRAYGSGASQNSARANWAIAGDQPLTLETWDFPQGGGDPGLVMYVGNPGNGTPQGAVDGFGIERGCGYGFGLVFGGQGCVISTGPTNIDNLVGYKEWRHLVVTRTSDGTWSLYMDAQLIGRTNHQPADPSSTTYLLGTNSHSTSTDLVETAIYSTDLSDTQIHDHFCSANQDSTDRIDSSGICGGSSLASVSGMPGYGAVFSEDGNIGCSPTCTHDYAPQPAVNLHAVAVVGSHFDHWSGDCSGVDPDCTVTMDQARNVVAYFKADGGDPPPPIGDPPVPPTDPPGNGGGGGGGGGNSGTVSGPCWYVQDAGASTSGLTCPGPGTNTPPPTCPSGKQVTPVWGFTQADGSSSSVSGGSYGCGGPPPVSPGCPSLEIGGSCGPTGPITVCPPGSPCVQTTGGYTGGGWSPGTGGGWSWGGGGGGGWGGYSGWGIYLPTCSSYWSGSGCQPFHADRVIYSPCVPKAPAPTSPPVINDPIVPGAPLSVNDGVWVGTPPMAFTHQWQYSADNSQTWHDIAGATDPTFNVPLGYEGYMIRVVVTNTNQKGAVDAISAPVGPATPASTPANVVRPALSGLTADGATLNLSRGSWAGSPTLHFSESWQRCDADGSNCSDVPGETDLNYTIGSADIGSRLQATVVVSNGGGQTGATTSQTEVVGASGLDNTSPPTISGTAQEAATLTANKGTWSYSAAPTYSYQWQHSTDNGVTWNNLSGAQARTYTPDASDIGAKLRVRVTAANSGGTQAANSAATSAVLVGRPQNTTPPTLAGTPRPGQALTATKGTWTGAGTISYSYQWQRCDTNAQNCTDISAASAQIYNVTSADNGKRLHVVVTATNAGGPTTAASAATSTVGPGLPAASALPTISGTTTQGSTLTGTQGTWSGTNTYARQWLRCDASGLSCDPISSETSATYVVTPADGGSTLRVRVTATNSAGSATVESDPTGIVQTVAPTSTAPPSISGGAQEGQVLTANRGSWSGTPSNYSYQWQRSTTQGGVWTTIASATSQTYTAQSADVGFSLRVTVTAQNSAGSDSATSAASAVVISSAPVSTVAPVIGGTSQLGEVLTGTRGTWLSGDAITYSYQWLRCDSAGTVCSAISGETTQSYTVKAVDISKRLRFQVTAENSGGQTAALSAATAVLTDNPPAGTALPLIAGQAREGQTLSTTTGSWSNAPSSFSYQWLRCDASGANCANIATATSPSYALQAADVGKAVAVKVTATNAGGSGTQTADPTAPVLAAAPQNATLPSVSGTAREESVLSGDRGSWTSTLGVTYSYQWQRGDGTTWANIPGATTLSYTVQTADIGGKLRFSVTAQNSDGATTKESVATNTVTQAPVKNTTVPVISGNTVEGSSLQTTDGVWDATPPLSYTYQWQRSQDNGSSYSNIAGATTSTYTLTAADANAILRARVTAQNADGSATAFSVATNVITPAAPVNSTLPTISGGAQEGQALGAARGSWSGSPTSYSQQWLRCADATQASCVAIAAATSLNYTVTSADIGSRLRISVTAGNVGGTSTATSNATAIAVAAPPVATQAPQLSGTFREGQQVSVSQGSWSSSATVTYSYQWQLSTDGGQNWANIAAATNATYTLSSTDGGNKIRAGVIASNEGGSATAFSSASNAIDFNAPTSTGLPVISGTTTQGQTLTTTNGSWNSTLTATYSYQWQRSTTVGGVWATIAGATSQTYTLQAADVGFSLRVTVTAQNSAGSDNATSAQSNVVAALPPQNTTPPSISGSAQEAQLLTAATGSWSSATSPAYSYQWQRCDAAGANCANIATATNQSYTLQAADVDQTVRVVVTATSSVGSTSANSAATNVVVVAAPRLTTSPTTSGIAQIDQVLTGTQGSWASTKPITSYGYQWLRCNSAGAACLAISGASATSYTIASADSGATLRFSVTATNAGGASSASSVQTAGVAVQGAPANSVLPTISGTPAQGQQWTATSGTWSGSPSSYSYQWQRCDGSGLNCASIAGAAAKNYTLVAADVNQTVRALVTAYNAAGSAQIATASSAVISGILPQNTALPTTSGTTQQNNLLTGTQGSWSNSPSGYSFQWQRCDAAGANCSNIAGAATQTYFLQAIDVGQTLRIVVTAQNAAGTAQANSAVTATITSNLPVNTAVPTTSGTLIQGNTVTGTLGSWTNSPSNYTFKWQRCDTDGTNCADISGAQTQSYLLKAADVGRALRFAVTALNASGSGSANSVVTSVISSDAPTLTVLPVISGTLKAGNTLTVTQGSWTGAGNTYTYQWQRCDSSGVNCANAASQAPTYGLGNADAGSTIRALVTATNSYGAVTATTATTAAIADAVPVVTVAPAISGTAQQGQTLTVANGTWANSPTSYAYQWQRSTTQGGVWQTIAGATAQTYMAQAADLGFSLRVNVTAANAAGVTSTTSDPSGVVLSSAGPSYSSTVLANSPVAYWRLDEPSGTTAADSSSTANNTGTYSLATLGATGALLSDSTNSGISFSGQSSQSVALTPVSRSSLTGTFTVEVWAKPAASGTFLSVLGSRTPSDSSFDIQINPSASTTIVHADIGNGSAWLTTNARATANVGVGSWMMIDYVVTPTITKIYVNGVDIGCSGACTYSAATPVLFDATHTLALGRNGNAPDARFNGSLDDLSFYASALSTATIQTHYAASGHSAGGVPPSNTVSPTISPASPATGQAMFVSNGSWNGTPTAYSYQWQVFSPYQGQTNSIAGANGASYTPLNNENTSSWPCGTGGYNCQYQVVVTATNSIGSTSVTTARTAMITSGLPANTAIPTITPTSGVRIGDTVTVSGNGTWTNSPTSFSYQWYALSPYNGMRSAIAGATGPSYVPMNNEDHSSWPCGTGGYNCQYQVVVTATNSVGSTTAVSGYTNMLLAGVPANTAIPTITPTSGVRIGDTVTVNSSGTWTNSPTSYSYQWYALSPYNGIRSAISGATGPAYTPMNNEDHSSWPCGTGGYNCQYQVVVTATNSVGSTTAASGYTNMLLGGAPANTAIPTISPQSGVRVGDTVTVTSLGNWTNNPTAFSYQWYALSPYNGQRSAIAGATSSAYTPLNNEDHSSWPCGTGGYSCQYQVVVTATNSVGSATATSGYTNQVLPGVPVNSSLPTVTPSSPQLGITMSADVGTWSNNPTSYSYQWYALSPYNAQRSAIAGATGPSYVPQNNEDHSSWPCGTGGQSCQYQVIVTATNSVGSASATSSYTTQVSQGPPINSTAPVISGVAQENQVLTTTNGTWQNSPTSYTYQWQSSTIQGGVWQNIAGATAQSYTAQAADVGFSMRVRVRAVNAVGSTDVFAAPSNVVASSPPVNTALPTISGTPQVGTTLTAANGSWNSSPTSYSYQWNTCTSSSYASTVTATSGVQSYWRFGNPSGATADAAGARTATWQSTPTYGASGAIAGDADTAITLNGTNNWASASAINLSRYTIETWFKPNGLQGTSSQAPAIISTTFSTTVNYAIGFDGGTRDVWGGFFDNVNGGWHQSSRITLSDNVWYHLVTSYDGVKVRLFVNGVEAPDNNLSTGNNYANATPSTTGAFFQIGARWDRASYPDYAKGTIDDTSVYNRALSSSEVVSHYNAGSTFSGCTPISGASGQTFIPTAAQQGKGLSVTVTATNAVGSTSANSVSTSAIAP
jgi:type II secretory pathway pseudopilin PulG